MNIFHQAILIFSTVVLSYLAGTGKIIDRSNSLATGVSIGLEPVAYDGP